MSIFVLLSMITETTEAVKALGSLKEKIDQRTTRSERDELIEALKVLYFAPNGVLHIFKDISKNNELDRQKALARLDAFDSSEIPVGDALSKLGFDSTEFIADLSLKDRRLLQEMAWQKKSIRSQTNAVLSSFLNEGANLDPNDAKQIREAILDLNGSIEEFEERLRG